jgi:hypothetical protein
VKGILLATAVSIAIFAGMTAIFRLYRVNVVAAVFVFVCAIIAFLILFAITPNDLGFLPLALIAEPQWLDSAVGCFALSASFFGGWLQLYNLIDRGYSLRMLVDMLHLPNHSATIDDILNKYADGHGLRWMYDIRISGILRTGLVVERNGILSLTPRGHRVASAFIFLRKLYKIGNQPT